MSDTKYLASPGSLKAAAPPGHLEAVFSTFHVADRDGDVVLPSAFTPGQAVPLVWAHDWQRPIGKGAIRVEPERAIFDGELFLDTTAGLDAYTTIKRMGALQEYSWGFQVLDSEPGTQGGQPVRFIKATEVFEVSPVLVGANRATGTLALKRGARLSRATRAELAAALDVLQRLLTEPGPDEPEPPEEPEPAEPPAPDAAVLALDARAALLTTELRGLRAQVAAAPANLDYAALGTLADSLAAAARDLRAARPPIAADGLDAAALYREFAALERGLAPMLEGR